MNQIAKKFRLSRIIILMLALGVVGGVQAFVSYQMADARHTWEGECKPIRWQTCKQHDHVEMVVSCSDKTTGTFEQDGRLIASYLNNPGPLSCWVSENGNLKCENRPPAPVKVAQGS